MSNRDPEKLDPSRQSGRPVIVTGLFIGLMVVLALLVVVFLLAT